MRNLFSTVVAASLLAVALLTGCSSSLSTVNLQGSSSVASSSVLVDIVGIGPNNQALKLTPVPKYWQGGAVKADAKSYRFGPNSPQTYTLAASDPIWKHWHDIGAKEVMVIADLPGVFPDLPGDSDARRKILPIASKSTSATIVVDKSGLVKSTP